MALNLRIFLSHKRKSKPKIKHEREWVNAASEVTSRFLTEDDLANVEMGPRISII